MCIFCDCLANMSSAISQQKEFQDVYMYLLCIWNQINFLIYTI